MDFLKAMDNFYYQMSLYELKNINFSDNYKDIYYNSLLYLIVISEIDNCTVSLLSEKLCITKSAVTIKINNLMKKGLLEKQQSEKDKRVIFIYLSKKGKDLLNIQYKIILEINDEINKKYSDREIEIFCKILEDVSNYNWKGNSKNE